MDIESGPVTDQQIVLDNGTSIPADEIILLTGHGKSRVVPGSRPAAWTSFSENQQNKGNRTSYVHLVYPIDEKTRHVEPGDFVYVIGMGLTAVDIVKTFTIGRGGKFKNGEYIPSGQEPFVSWRHDWAFPTRPGHTIKKPISTKVKYSRPKQC